MANRFQKNRRRALIAGCVFCCIAGAIALSGGAQAAMISAQVLATGTQFIGGDSSLSWQISSSNNSAPPMVCGQEIVLGSATDSFLTGSGGSYQSAIGLQNADLINMQVQRDVSLTHGSYAESLLYEGYGAGMPAGGCGGESFGTQGQAMNTTGENETIPAVDPYCSSFMVSTGMIGDLKYQSIGGIVSGDEEIPDMTGFQFQGTGNGMGALSVGSTSITPIYSNRFTEHVIASGKPFSIGGKFEFTSFALTFDQPVEQEA